METVESGPEDSQGRERERTPVREQVRSIPIRGLHVIEQIGLLIIVLATIVAVGQEVALLFSQGHVRLADLLLLFIYLEIIAMVAIYYKSHKLPVRFPLYIAMVAMARYLLLDAKDMTPWEVVAVSLTILVLAFAVLVVRIGHIKFPYSE